MNTKTKNKKEREVCFFQKQKCKTIIQVVFKKGDKMINSNKLLAEIAKARRTLKSTNQDYITGYYSALSFIEGCIDELKKEPKKPCNYNCGSCAFADDCKNYQDYLDSKALWEREK